MHNEINTSIAKKQASSTDVLDMIHAIMYDSGTDPAGNIATARIENCKNEMDLIHKIANNRATMPVLQSVNVCIAQGIVSFNATNIESSVIASFPAEITGHCNILIPWGKHFRQKNLDIKVLPGNIVFVNGTKLAYRDPDEFPSIAVKPSGSPNFMLTRNDMSNLQSAAFYCSNDEIKPALTGFHFDGKRFTATDGHKLIVKYCDNPGHIKPQVEGEDPATAIIPAFVANFMPLVKKITASDPLPCWIDTDQQWSWIKVSEKITLWFRLIDEHFPNFESVIPKPQDAKYYCEISGSDLKSIMTTVKPAFVSTNGVVNNIRFGSKYLTTFCQIKDSPSTQVFDNPTDLQPPFEIQFNYYFLRSIFNRFPDADTVRIYFYSPISAVLFIRTDENYNDEINLLMPIKPND